MTTTTTTTTMEPSKVVPINNPHLVKESTSTTTTPSNNNVPEYAMIELNGELISPVEFPTSQECQSIFDSHGVVELGKLYFDDNTKNPVMILGNHQLKGSIEKLKDPFCLFEKIYGDDDDNDNDDGNNSKSLRSYNIKGMITTKYLFNNYPKVIMR